MKTRTFFLFFFIFLTSKYCFTQSIEEQYNLGVDSFENGDYEKAITIFTKIIKINPNYKNSLYFRGSSKNKVLDYRGAINDFNKALLLNPKFAEAYNNRGNAKLKLKDYKGAIYDFSYAIKINPNFMLAYFNRGLARISLGQKKDACLDFSKAGESGISDAYEAIKEYCQ